MESSTVIIPSIDPCEYSSPEYLTERYSFHSISRLDLIFIQIHSCHWNWYYNRPNFHCRECFSLFSSSEKVNDLRTSLLFLTDSTIISQGPVKCRRCLNRTISSRKWSRKRERWQFHTAIACFPFFPSCIRWLNFHSLFVADKEPTEKELTSQIYHFFHLDPFEIEDIEDSFEHWMAYKLRIDEYPWQTSMEIYLPFLPYFRYSFRSSPLLYLGLLAGCDIFISLSYIPLMSLNLLADMAESPLLLNAWWEWREIEVEWYITEGGRDTPLTTIFFLNEFLFSQVQLHDSNDHNLSYSNDCSILPYCSSDLREISTYCLSKNVLCIPHINR